MKNTILALTACTLFLSPRVHAALIHESWSGYENGAAVPQFSGNGGVWSLESGTSASLQIAEYPDSDSGNGLQVIPTGGSWVRVVTADGYSAPNGVRYDLQIKRLNDLQAFTRMRIQDSYALSGTTGYYLQVSGTALSLTMIYDGGSPTSLGTWEFGSTEFVPDTTYTFSLEVRANDAGNQVNVYFNNTRVISTVDTGAGRLDLSTSELYFGFDNRNLDTSANNAKAMYGNIQIQAIPEPSSAMLVLAAAGGMAGGSRLLRRGRK